MTYPSPKQIRVAALYIGLLLAIVLLTVGTLATLALVGLVVATFGELISQVTFLYTHSDNLTRLLMIVLAAIGVWKLAPVISKGLAWR